MTWRIKWDDAARKQLRKLDHSIQQKILKFMREHLSTQDNPRVFGKALSHDKAGLWRYRLEDYRIVCNINDTEIDILVVQVGHRKKIYDI